MKWVTRERVKVDRVACPWLIRRFIDRDAELLFVPADSVESVARSTGATPTPRHRASPDVRFAVCTRFALVMIASSCCRRLECAAAPDSSWTLGP